MATLLDFRMPDEMLAELARIQQGRNGGEPASSRRDAEQSPPSDARPGGIQVARIATLAEFDEALGETLGARGATVVAAIPAQPSAPEPLESQLTEAELEPSHGRAPLPASSDRSAASRITDELATLDPVDVEAAIPPPFVVDDAGLEGDPLAEDAFASGTSDAAHPDEPIDLGAFAARTAAAGLGRSTHRAGDDGLDTVDLPSDDEVDGGDPDAEDDDAGREAPGAEDAEAEDPEAEDAGAEDAEAEVPEAEDAGAEADQAGAAGANAWGDDDFDPASDARLDAPPNPQGSLHAAGAARGRPVGGAAEQATPAAEDQGPAVPAFTPARPAVTLADDPGATQPGLALSDIARRIREEARRSGEMEAAGTSAATDATPTSERFEAAEVAQRRAVVGARSDHAAAAEEEQEVDQATSGADGLDDEGLDADGLDAEGLDAEDLAEPADGGLPPSGATDLDDPLAEGADELGASRADAPRSATPSVVGRPTLPDGLLPSRVGDVAAALGAAPGAEDEADGAPARGGRADFDLTDAAEATGSADELLESVDASFDDILDPPDPHELVDAGAEAAFDDLLDPGHALTIPPESVDEPTEARGGAGDVSRPRPPGLDPADDHLDEALSALAHGDERAPQAPRSVAAADAGDTAAEPLRAPRPPPIPNGGARYVLRVVSLGAGEGRLVELNGEPQVIGTAGSLRIEDAYASEQHARVAVEGARMRVDDLDSLNGVWLRLRAGRVLQPGDRFLAGRQVLRLVRESGVSAPSAVGGVERLGARASSSGYRLQVLGADDSVLHDLRVPQDGCRIGRHLADLVFTDDDQLSATHAVVRPDGAGVRLDDLGSRNGTWVRVRGQLDLGVGDAFMTGRTVWRVSQPAR